MVRSRLSHVAMRLRSESSDNYCLEIGTDKTSHRHLGDGLEGMERAEHPPGCGYPSSIRPSGHKAVLDASRCLSPHHRAHIADAV